MEEKLTKLEQDFQNKENEMLDLKQSLKDKMDKIKEHESTIGKLQDSEVEKKIRQKMRERFETEQKEMHENFKKKLKREVEAAKSQVTKELRHKHLKVRNKAIIITTMGSGTNCASHSMCQPAEKPFFMGV